MASATGFAIVDALVVVLGRADLTDRDRLAAFHAVFALVIGSAQAELAGPLTGGASEAAATIGAVAGSEFPHVEQLSKVAMATTVEDDFDRGLQMLIAGIAARSR